MTEKKDMKEMAPPSKGGLKRSMSLMSETMARATVEGSVFPPAAKCPDFPLPTYLFVDRAPTDKQLMDAMKKLTAWERFRSRPVGPTPFVWLEVDDMESKLMDHVTKIEVNSEEELKKEMDHLLVKPLDTTRPLWDVSVITPKDGVVWKDEGLGRKPPVVCIRVSHGMGDGLTLANVLRTVATGVDGKEMQTVKFSRRTTGSSISSLSLTSIYWRIVAVLTFIPFNLYILFKTMLSPIGFYDSKTAFRDTSKKTIFKQRTMVVCKEFDVEEMKEVKTKMGCTVGDVVISCLSGAIQKYQKHFEDPEADRKPLLRAALPYAFPDRPKDVMTNSFTFVSLPLVMGPMSIVSRLRATQKKSESMKNSLEPFIVHGLNTVFRKLLGAKFQTQAGYDFLSRQSMVLSIVPGPTAPVMLFGTKVNSIVFGCGNCVSQVSFLSYNGKMALSLVVDPEEVPDAHLIGDFFQQELTELRSTCKLA